MAPSSFSSSSHKDDKRSSKQKGTKNKKRRRNDDHDHGGGIAAAYVEDITMIGIKKKKSSSSSQHHQPKLSGGNPIHELKVDDEEEYRRLQRMQRFGGTGNVKNDDVNEDDDTEKRLFQALSSSRDRNKVSSSVATHKIQKRSGGGNKVQPLQGTSTSLEKSYLRLTTDPKPEDVRPLPILRKSLAHIKSQFVQNEDFDWANDQLKAVRQDLTVQHIRNSFVLDVYESHARILLEHGDLNEFNQCQTMIRSLTNPTQLDNSADEGGGVAKASSSPVTPAPSCLRQSEQAQDEFAAYGLLYSLVQHSSSDMIMTLSYFSTQGQQLQHQQKQKQQDIPLIMRGSAFRHALQVVKAVTHNDYHTFFRLYVSAPHMSAYLMDFLLRRIRKAAYDRIVASYRPSIGVEQFRTTLVFDDLEETRRFLKKNGAVWMKEEGGCGPPSWVDCKASFLAL